MEHNNWIHKTVDEIWLDPELEIGLGNKTMFANLIAIGIDTSASTDNRHGRNRVAKSITDPIIVAEIKGIIYYLIALSNIYNVIGLTFKLFTFSDETTFVNDFNVNSLFEFKNYLQSIPRIINYKFSDTNLMSFLTKTINESNEKTHIVIATDGQPNRGGDVNDISNYLKQIPLETYNNLSLAIIGAGSIQTSHGGSEGIRSLCSSRGSAAKYSLNGNVYSLEQLNKQFRFSSSSECNIEFLLQIMEHFPSSIYLPSFGDYSKLRRNSYQYLNSIETSNGVDPLIYQTILDGGTMAQLPLNVCHYLDMGNNCIAYLEMSKSWYLFTKKWQVALSPVIEILNNQIFIAKGDFSFDFTVAYKNKDKNIIESDGGIKFIPKTNEYGYWLCRQIVRAY